ncbi:carboxypeptidase-like regulatory domain-containing protein [Pedobacter sp. N36a]|uniref:carboxypeptidase-like regulatory domain-containing protein n=1 Tax=Pedobacter sp. N36a TaxID=2767996 RepID=UPI0016570ACF|nr:carboxypeptidase-like regulatory domain-containing protein [Pedobacter sp. N36a]MBC8986813.1 carboxypeptidase-like regulatory domain-containing protein [Pedobacter sp. N36a]
MSIHFADISLLTALNLLITGHSLPLSFDPGIITAEKKINGYFTNKPVSTILNTLLSGTGLSYKLLFGVIIITQPDKFNVSLNGRVVDAESGEDLIGASVYIPALEQGVSTNNYGFYSLTITNGVYEVQITHIGYAPLKLTLSLKSHDQTFVIRMNRQIKELQEIQVSQSPTQDSLKSLNVGKTLNWEMARQRPYLKGESDVIKALQMENGIVPLTEGSSQMFIRGGNKDQNLIILDEAIIYNPGHLFGLTSVFNPDALKNLQIYTDAIPANFGGRLSSVIDVRTADGDDKQFHVKGGISLLTARVSLEGPIIKEKSSFLFSARRSLANLLSKDLELFDLRPSYYDLNFKANRRIGTSDRIFFSVYKGRDKVRSANGYLNTWGNQTATIRWNHLFNPKLFSNLSLIYSNYKNELSINADSSYGTDKWLTGIRDATFKGDFTYYPNPQHQVQYGFSSILHLFIPGESKNDFYNDISRARAGEYALYFSHKLFVSKRVSLQYGLRTSLFHNTSVPGSYDLDDTFSPVIIKDGSKTFFRLEPRLTLQYLPKALGQLQLNYARNYQYLQLVQNDELAFSSLESWIPAGINLLPQRSDFYSLKYKDRSFAGTYSIDLYYKTMRHQLELVDNAQLISNPFVESQLRPGQSNAYGLEISLYKDINRFKGTLMYAFSKVYRTINEINEGKKYPAGYDIPHSVKVNMSYNIAQDLSVNSFFTYSTGRPVMIPIGYFDQKGLKIPIYGEKNASRMPAYHRLDLTLQWSPTSLVRQKNWSHTFSVGLFNIYNHKNILFYRISQEPTQEVNFDQQSFSGRTLGLSYNFKF